MGLAEQPSAVPAIRRALAILDFVTFVGVATPSTISDHFGLAKSSIFDLVGTMVETGMLHKNGDGLVVGPAFSQFSDGLISNVAPISTVRRLWQRNPVLREHTVSIQALVGSRNLCVDVNVGAHLLPYNPRPGMRADLWNGGGSGEPVLGSFTADEIMGETHPFRAFFSARAASERAPLRAGFNERTNGAEQTAALSHTGNLEINTRLALSAMPPIALTLHLPPEFGGNTAALGDALSELANASVRQSPDPASGVTPVRHEPR